MIDIALFAEVMKFAEDAYNEGKPESDRKHLELADAARILADENLSL